MAVVTTFITSPLFHYAYVRGLKQRAVARQASKVTRAASKAASHPSLGPGPGSPPDRVPDIAVGVGVGSAGMPPPHVSLSMEPLEFTAAMQQVRHILHGDAPIVFEDGEEEVKGEPGAAQLEPVRRMATTYESTHRVDGGDLPPEPENSNEGVTSGSEELRSPAKSDSEPPSAV